MDEPAAVVAMFETGAAGCQQFRQSVEHAAAADACHAGQGEVEIVHRPLAVAVVLQAGAGGCRGSQQAVGQLEAASAC